MTSAPRTTPQAERGPFGLTQTGLLALLLGLTALRVIGLILSPLNLHGDEAQYWAWSRTLDWGYFSKPPLIAWTIALTTAIFGNAEWAVRLAAPLLHLGAAWALYLLGKRLYGPRAGMWAAIGWALLPATWLSSAIISTDALLLPIWAVALLFAQRFIETKSWRWALALGAAIGIGLLAKYAMLYFLVGIALACLWSKEVRAAFLSPRGLLVLLTAAAFVAPNIAWNASHKFATISHTAANADLDSNLFNPDELLEFLSAQFGVAGPLMFAALLVLIFQAARGPKETSEADRFLLAFVLPALTIIAVQALLARAHGNWAASAYPAAVIWIAGRFAGKNRWVLQASTVLHAVFGLFLCAAALSPALANGIGMGNALKRVRGWEETARIVAERAEADQFTAVAVDNRLLFFGLNYYWRDHPPKAPLRMWLLHATPGNQAEAQAPLTVPDGGHVLIVNSTPDYADFIANDFAHYAATDKATIPLGGDRERVLDFAIGETYAPAPRDADFERRLNAARADKSN